jgi:hypothetical protein
MKRFYLAGVAFALFFSGGASPGFQEIQVNEGLLAGLLVKTWTLRERALADIQTSDRELQTSEARFQEAEKRMTNAVETYNDQAIHAAREPLRKARADLKKLKQTRARLDLAMTWAEASYAAVRKLLVSGQGQGSHSLIRGLVSFRSGQVKVFRKNGEEVAFDSTHPRFLEPGDGLVTMGASSAEVLVFDGRASVLLGEHSRLKLEEDGPQEEVLQLIQGKIYCAIDKVDEFADLLQDSARNFESDQKLTEAVARTGERIKGWTDKKFTVRTPSACCSVRSTEFTIGPTSGGGTEIAILEGAVDVGDAECAKQVPVEQGFRVIVTKDGISEPQKIADIDKWWEK